MKKISLLVVDDNLASRMLPQLILRHLIDSVQVIETENGVEALNMLELHSISHVLLDISMPDINGLEVLEFIKKNPINSSIRLIAYTADILFLNSGYLNSLGFHDVLLKPLNRKDLLAVLGVEQFSAYCSDINNL